MNGETSQDIEEYTYLGRKMTNRKKYNGDKRSGKKTAVGFYSTKRNAFSLQIISDGWLRNDC